MPRSSFPTQLGKPCCLCPRCRSREDTGASRGVVGRDRDMRPDESTARELLNGDCVRDGVRTGAPYSSGWSSPSGRARRARRPGRRGTGSPVELLRYGVRPFLRKVRTVERTSCARDRDRVQWRGCCASIDDQANAVPVPPRASGNRRAERSRNPEARHVDVRPGPLAGELAEELAARTGDLAGDRTVLQVGERRVDVAPVTR